MNLRTAFRSKAKFLLLLIHCLLLFPLFVSVLCLSSFCNAVLILDLQSSRRGRELETAYCLLCCGCPVAVSVLYLFFVVPWVGLWPVIVVTS